MAAQAPPTNVEVRLLNGTRKILPLTGTTTFRELSSHVARKMELAPSLADIFAVFHVKAGYERLPAPADLVLPVLMGFEADDAAAKKEKKRFRFRGESYFVYKKQLVGRRRELECLSPASLTLLFYQARHDVLASRFPVNGSDVLELAGVQMQIDFGDYDESARAPGYLERHNILDQYVPGQMLEQKLHTAAEWEREIFPHYAEHVGKSHEQALRTYLNLARKSKFYGARVFFPADYCVGTDHMPAPAQLALTSTALVLLDPESHTILVTYPYISIRSWGALVETDEFQVVVWDAEGRPQPPLTMKTPECTAISAALLAAATEAAAEKKLREEESVAAFKAATVGAATPRTPRKDASSLATSALSKWKTKVVARRESATPAPELGARAAPAEPPRPILLRDVDADGLVTVLQFQRQRVRRRRKLAKPAAT